MIMSTDKPQLDIPNDAIVLYGTPRWSKGSLQDHNSWYWYESEEDIRRIARGASGNGSGLVSKKVKYWAFERGDSWQLSTDVVYIEELEPVTDFDDSGISRRTKYLTDIACTHSETKATKSGAGCQTWVEITCADCGIPV
jgi:hypothetical protein